MSGQDKPSALGSRDKIMKSLTYNHLFSCCWALQRAPFSAFPSQGVSSVLRKCAKLLHLDDPDSVATSSRLATLIAPGATPEFLAYLVRFGSVVVCACPVFLHFCTVSTELGGCGSWFLSTERFWQFQFFLEFLKTVQTIPAFRSGPVPSEVI